jgi:two-component system, NarL family, sensor histidine kinase UhpB
MTVLLGSDQTDGVGTGQRFHAARRDIAVVAIVTLLTWALCVRFEVSEALFHWSRNIERLQLDELPMVLLMLSIGLLWFAVRRYREGNALWQQQRATDERLRLALSENRRLTQQYMNALESERKHLARELHDELGQYLNAIKLDAVAIRQAATEHHEVRATAESIVRNADHVYSVVGELIRQLRPVGLDELGLVTAIENLVESWRPRLSMTIDLNTEGPLDDLPEQMNLTLFRAVQEALTNAAKHAQAKRIAIRLSRVIEAGRSIILLAIEDDGVGIDASKQPGFGLLGIRERVEMQGGRFELTSATRQGVMMRMSFAI